MKTAPPAIQYGSVLNSFEYLNSVITYVCQENHTMIGTATLACEAPGLWRPKKAPKCIPPPKPIPTILYPDNETKVQPEEDVEPEEVEVVTEMTKLMNDKDASSKAVQAVKDKEMEVREIAEEHYKTDQKQVQEQQQETSRMMNLDKNAKAALQAKIDQENMKEAEEEQKRKDADDAVVTQMEEERKRKEELVRAKQEAAAQKRGNGRSGGGGGGGSNSGAPAGTPGTGMLTAEPTEEETVEAVKKAKAEESVEQLNADLTGKVHAIGSSKKSVVEAENNIKQEEQKLAQLETSLNQAKGNLPLEQSITQNRNAAVDAVEKFKKQAVAAKLTQLEVRKELDAAMADPAVKKARISKVQGQYDNAVRVQLNVKMSVERNAKLIQTVEKEIQAAKMDDTKKDAVVALQKEIKELNNAHEQSKLDLARVTAESKTWSEKLANMKDAVETGTVEDLIKQVEETSAMGDTQGVGLGVPEHAKSEMIRRLEKSTVLDEDTKNTAIAAVQNAQDLAQTSTILNAAGNGADAIRQAAATPASSTTVFTSSDVVGDFVMSHPSYPGRLNWEIFAVRTVGGAGMMGATSAHDACRSFPNSQLVTHDIAHAGRMSGFQRCQPGWIERFGADVPDEDAGGQCATPPSTETGKCAEGTIETRNGNTLECRHECPAASAVIMAGDAGCPTDQAPPCEEEGTIEFNGNCMTPPGTVVASTTVVAQALCTRPKSSVVPALLEVEEEDDTAARKRKKKPQMPALLVYNISTGLEVNRHYDLKSEKGRSLDPQTNYLLTGGMLIAPMFHYNAPVVYSMAPSSGPASGGTTITVAGLNFGPNDAYFGNKLTLAVEEINGRDGQGWVDCRTTVWVSDGVAKCITPAGVGTFRKVRASLATLVGEETTKTGFTYNRPVLTKVVPNKGKF